MRYPIVVHKEKGSAYGVTVPDVPGCFSAGDSLEEAFANAKEAIFAHLELVTQDGGDIPEAKEVDDHIGNPDYKGGTWAYVNVNVEDLLGPAERINVTIPKRALQKIDAAAAKQGESRSGLLTRAAIQYIGKATDRGRFSASPAASQAARKPGAAARTHKKAAKRA